ncbi:MAG: UvrD-helicase domain-containing protein, partial [Myxococcota bacterium]|nr:UvrD-helicase domain-containing protein [Myxococcota bacterium]
WCYVLIDEFQDTDETQWSIFRRAFFGQGAASSILCLVGDPKQSIYRFRGADVHTYLRARDEISAAGGARVPLDQNYRATARLVDATNTLFDAAAAEPLFSGTIAYTAVTCGRPLRTLVDGGGEAVTPVHVLRFGGEGPDPIPLRALGARIAREIRTLTDPARPFRLDGRPLEHHDVFLLTRTSREGRTLGAALRAEGVPYAFYKEEGLFQTDEAREIRALLVAIDDPTHRANRLAAWLTPFFGLPLASLQQARDLRGTHPLVTQLHAWRAMAHARDFDGLFESLVSDSGVVRRELFFSQGERELTNYLHVLEALLEHARHTQATLRDLVHELSGLIERTRLPLDLEGNVQRLDSERRAVQIMTIHKAKGLEAPIVFLAGGFKAGRGDEVRVYHEAGRRLAWVGRLEDGPAEGEVKREEDEEEQRLMYVALTRAQGRLYLPCAVMEASARASKTSPGDAKKLRGPYERVNRRVARLVRDGEPSMSVEDVVVERPEAPSTDVRAASTGESSAWTPPAALLRPAHDEAPYAALRENRAGAFVTSYTRMKSGRGSVRVASIDDPDEDRREKAVDATDELSPTSLRAARTSGIFLHELLERVPVESFAAASFEPWRLRPEVSSLVAEAVAIHRIEGSQREHAEQMVWRAYTTPLDLPDGRRVDGIARAARVVREMDFVFPILGPVEATTAGVTSGVAMSPRGYLRGSIDVAFEHAGVTYFVDWKSDSLNSFEPESLARHARTFYEQQAQLYTLAIVKLLGIGSREEHAARFGGVLYCFLRGMGSSGRGIWTLRPSWDEVLGWERALRARPAVRGGLGAGNATDWSAT